MVENPANHHQRFEGTHTRTETESKKIPPTVIALQKWKKCLFSVGVTHTQDPRDPSLEMLKLLWSEYLKRTQDYPGGRIVLLEGGQREIEKVETNEEYDTLIKQHGEIGYIALLARKANVETLSLEPTLDRPVERVLRRRNVELNYQFNPYIEALHPSLNAFDADSKYVYWIGRLFRQMNAGGYTSEEQIRTYLELRIATMKESLQGSDQFKDFDFSFENFERIYESKFDAKPTAEEARWLTFLTVGHMLPEKFKDIDKEYPEHWQNHQESGNNIIAISEAVNALRDDHNYDIHHTLWTHGWSPFSIQGEPHTKKLLNRGITDWGPKMIFDPELKRTLTSQFGARIAS